MVVAGRLPDPRQPSEVAVNESAASSRPPARGRDAPTARLFLRTNQQRGIELELVGHTDRAGRPLVPGARDRDRALSPGRQCGAPARGQAGGELREPAQPLHHPGVPPAAGAGPRRSCLAGAGRQPRRRAAPPWRSRLEGVPAGRRQGIGVGGHPWRTRQRVRDASGCGERRTRHPSRRRGAPRVRPPRRSGHDPVRRPVARTPDAEPGRRLHRTAEPRSGSGPAGNRGAPARRARRRRRSRPRGGRGVCRLTDHAGRAGPAGRDPPRVRRQPCLLRPGFRGPGGTRDAQCAGPCAPRQPSNQGPGGRRTENACRMGLRRTRPPSTCRP